MSEREIYRRCAIRSASGRSSSGKLDGAYILASETCAFDLDPRGIHSRNRTRRSGHHQRRRNALRTAVPRMSSRRFACSSTSISPDRTASSAASTSRRSAPKWDANWRGRFPVEADIVVPVPDSGNYAALGFARGAKHSLRARLCPQSLHRAHVSPAEPAHSRFRCAGEIESDQGSGGRETRRRGG